MSLSLSLWLPSNGVVTREHLAIYAFTEITYVHVSRIFSLGQSSRLMAPIPLLVTATKLAGVLVTITVAANAVSFSRYRKRNLAPFDSPIDETSDTLAIFNVNCSDSDDGKLYFRSSWNFNSYINHLLEHFSDMKREKRTRLRRIEN